MRGDARRLTAAREMLTPLPPACEVTDADPLHGAALERAGERDRAVVAGVGGEGDDHATTTSTPAALEGPDGPSALDRGVGDEHVDLVEGREAERRSRRRSWWSRRARRCAARAATIARLVAASSRSGVVRPWLGGDAVGAEERDVGAQVGQRRDGVGADRGLRRGPHPAGQQVQLDLGQPGEPGGDGHGVGDDGEPVVAGEQAASRRGGGAGVDDDVEPAAGSRARAAWAIWSFSAGCWPGRARRGRTR